MIHCKDCRHWEQTGDWHEPKGGDLGHCRKITENGDVRVYWDSEPVGTEADFGCVLGEKKEEK